MCGRFYLKTLPAELAALFGAAWPPGFAVPGPRYNIAPMQPILAVRAATDPTRAQRSGGVVREFSLLRWGLIPSWSKDASIASRTINARLEGIEAKPAFRAAFRSRRCLIPADGFFEWKQLPGDGRKPAKQPMAIQIRRDDGSPGPFAMAGLFESWNDPASGDRVETCTVITREANAFMRDIHDRMPVVVPPGAWGAWLDPSLLEPEAILALCPPIAQERCTAVAVSTRVNSPRNDTPACIVPVDTPSAGGLFGPG